MEFTKGLLKRYIDEADAILIGAGAGLSTAAGFEYGGKAFLDNFAYMHEKYGYTDMYSAGFHPFKTSQEKWGYWSKFIYLNRFKDGAKPLYIKLRQLVDGHNYFVLTTNVDHQFQLAGFDRRRLFYTQGDYGLFQCSKACHQKTYDNQSIIELMVDHIHDGKIPSNMVPRCPVCGSEMETNLRKDNLFVQDEGWHLAKDRYLQFVQENAEKRILLLELGVGFNTPGIIKYPFWNMVASNSKATYICLNKGEAFVPEAIAPRAICLNVDIGELLL